MVPASIPVPENHSHSGFGSPSPGSRSTCNRITVPSRIGRVPAWSAQTPRWVGQQRVQPIEGPGHRVPYRLVSVVVLWAGSGQVRGSLSFNTGP
jgi:hypothetical protein